MKNEMFSLLYPPHYPVEQRHNATLDSTHFSGLGIERLFERMNSSLGYKPKQKHPTVYFTSDIEVLRYRIDMVEDILRNDSLYQILEELLPDLGNLRELQLFIQGEQGDPSSSLYSVAELELYLNCVEGLHTKLQNEKLQLSSDGMKAFTTRVISIYESEDFQTLRAEADRMTRSIRNIKSVTVGINLDAQLKPIEAGIVSVNETLFRSGNIIDRILRLDFKNDGFTCLAPLQFVQKGLNSHQNAAIQGAVNYSLSAILESSLKSWHPVIRKYTVTQSQFLVGLADEIRFLLSGVSLLKQLKQLGVPICKPIPEQMEKRCFDVSGLYNPVFVLRSDGSVIANDIVFDENGMIYLLTGPNQGGKTVFTQSIGIAQVMFQLGLFVPAYSARISPVDGIFTHFQSSDLESNTTGRFGEECVKLKEIFGKISRHSLLLMDETFSSTSAMEATYIAGQVLLGLRVVGCRTVFATHLHELAREIDDLNQYPGGEVKIDHLTAKLKSNSDERSFVIVRGVPEGSSYAADIAKKYGLTIEDLMATIEKRETV